VAFFFQHIGKTPCLREAENRMNKHGVKSLANSLRNLAGMLSGPAAFDRSRSCKSLVIPEACKSISDMEIRQC